MQLQIEEDALRKRLTRIDDQIRSMTLRARTVGTLLIPRDGAQQEQFYPQGKEVGFILTDAPGMLVKVALTEAQASLVRDHTTHVTVVLPDGSHRIVGGQLQRETPSITQVLPNPALGSSAGGPVLTDPADAEGRRTLAPVVIVDVVVPDVPTKLIGVRTWVRFEHPAEPLASQWGRSVKQAFLSRLGSRL